MFSIILDRIFINENHLFRRCSNLQKNIQYRSTLRWFTLKKKALTYPKGQKKKDNISLYLDSLQISTFGKNFSPIALTFRQDTIQRQRYHATRVEISIFRNTVAQQVSNKVNNPSNFSNLIDTIPEHRSMYSIVGWELTLPECNRVRR